MQLFEQELDLATSMIDCTPCPKKNMWLLFLQ